MINEILQSFVGDTQDNTQMVKFMSKLCIIKSNIEQIMSKPFKTEIDVDPNDLPRYLTEFRSRLTECREYEQLLSLKNEIIYQLLNRKIVISKQTVENFDCAAQEELKRWIELYKDCSDQLEEFN